MSRNLFTRLFSRASSARVYRLPDGLRVYAIGDIHGRRDRMLAAEAAIAADLARRPPAGEALVVFIGDYVDRGPDSRGVLEALVGRRFAGLPARLLMGNHEDAMLRFLDDPAIGPAWFEHGGMATLASYNVRPEGPQSKDRFERLRLGLLAVLPEAHRRLLEELELSIQLGDFFFVHAGVRPSRPLDAQLRDDLLSIREPFLAHRRPLAGRVVHGHTIVDQPVIAPHRIAIDTGAYATGALTCIVVEGAGVAVLPAA